MVDDGLTGILYLHAPSDDPESVGKAEATCFVYNRIDPIESNDVQSYRPNPPPIARGYASKGAVCREPKCHTWRLVWSSEGEVVVLMRDGKAWGIVSLGDRRGFSRAIDARGPWGSPWSDEVYEATQWGGRARRRT
jgi:hypothetical protein